MCTAVALVPLFWEGVTVPQHVLLGTTHDGPKESGRCRERGNLRNDTVPEKCGQWHVGTCRLCLHEANETGHLFLLSSGYGQLTGWSAVTGKPSEAPAGGCF